MFSTLAEYPNLVMAVELMLAAVGFLTGAWLGNRRYRRTLDAKTHAAILADSKGLGWLL